MTEPKVKRIEIEYPRNPDAPFDTVEVDLLDVRSADSIRIHYDFERDGWSVQQARVLAESEGVIDGIQYLIHRQEWEEVAFCQAWALGDPPP